MPSVDHSIVELDDGEYSRSPTCCHAHPPLPGPPGDEGDVEVVWHRASGRASTPPLGPPGDTYDPFQVGFFIHDENISNTMFFISRVKTNRRHREGLQHLHLVLEVVFLHCQVNQ